MLDWTSSRTRRSLLTAGSLFAAGEILATSARRRKKKTFRDRDCSDFATQDEAQRFFEQAGGPAKDKHGLDTDRDGIACEELPVI
jgi:hypothetical protein